MIKTRIQVLEELFNKVLEVSMDAEIQVDYMKTQDPKKVIYPNKEIIVAGIKMRNDWTAQMVIAQNESKLKEDNEILEIIKKKIEEEEDREHRRIKGLMTSAPKGPTG